MKAEIVGENFDMQGVRGQIIGKIRIFNADEI